MDRQQEKNSSDLSSVVSRECWNYRKGLGHQLGEKIPYKGAGQGQNLLQKIQEDPLGSDPVFSDRLERF